MLKYCTYSLRFVIPVPCFLFRSSLFPVSLPMSSKSCVYIFHRSMSVSLFSFDFVAPPPSVCFTLCIVYVWSSCCVYLNIDFLVLTLISCSRRQLSCPLSVYFDICDYLDSDLCLFHNDFCLAPLNFFFTSLCNWVPSFTSPLPHVTTGLMQIQHCHTEISKAGIP